MLSVVSVNTELVNTEQLILFPGEIQGEVPWAPGHSISSTSQYVTLFYVCFYVKMPYLTYVADSLTLNSWPTACSSCLNDNLTCFVKHKGFLRLGTTDSTRALHSEPFWAVKSPIKSLQMQKYVALNRPWTRQLFTERELNEKAVLPCPPQRECGCRWRTFFLFFCSAHLCKWPELPLVILWVYR